MLSSSNRLFLLFLLLLILLPVSLLLKVVRGYATRTINLVARALMVIFEYSRAWAPRLFQAPTVQERTTTMSETLISRRDENDRWQAIIRESEATIEKYLVPEINIELASLIRCITFRVFLVVFLGVDPDTLDTFAFPNVQWVTAALSDFYGDGQGKSTLPFEVQSILYNWLPHQQFPSSLERILPVYEALWQIIATIVVTCEDDETKALRWVMLDFRDNPRDRQYRASFGGGGSVSDITDDAVGRITPIARPQHATTSTWPLSCIQYASASSSMPVNRPTVQEALKFAALLASMVIGQVGVHYGISGDGVTRNRASPWEQRRIFGINRASGHIAINVPEIRLHASPSRQVY